MTGTEAPDFETLRRVVLDVTQPAGKRTRAVFYLRTRGTKEDLAVLLEAMGNKQDSELMRHEIAYVVGQFKDVDACAALEQLVADEDENLLVRHESAEALGAIGSPASLALLQKYVAHPAVELAETAQLAVELIQYKAGKAEGKIVEEEHDHNPYRSEDPAPAFEKHVPTAVLRETLLSTSASLFDKYRAMFSLRNRNTEEAALALAEGFKDPSALFRHEIAYVMGQMENPVTIPALLRVLQDKDEHRMVRHEAAEALGELATPEVEAVLKQFLHDEHPVVKESCQVALDIADYWAN
jgi:deoxyhypusine monooxygenase